MLAPDSDKVKHTRTKTGCLTCRRRKKKCPGNYDQAGTCQRCQNTNSTCVPAPPTGTLTRRHPSDSSSSSSPRHAPGHALRHDPSRSAPVASTSKAYPLPMPPSTSAAAVRATHLARSPAFVSALPPHIIAATSSSANIPSSIAHLPPNTPGYSTPPPFGTQPFAPSAHGSSLAAEPSTAYFDSTLAPIADLSQMHDIESFFESLNPAIDASNLTADWPIPVAASSTPSNSTPTSATTPVTSNLGPRGSASPSVTTTTSISNGAGKTEAETSLAEALTQLESIPIYNALNDAFFSSMPKPVREILRHRMTDVAFSSSLGKSACLALCLLYRAKTMEDDGSTETRERLIAQSNAYFQQAVEHLQTSQVPLEAQILAVFDLQMYQLEQYGAAASYAILLLGDYFVSEALGPNPKIDLSTLSGPSSVLLRSFAYADVLRSVCLRSQPTLFHLVGAPGMPPDEAPQTSSDPPHPIVTSEVLHLLGGLPLRIMLCLGATSNLACERASLDPAEYDRRAGLIETAIKEWIPLGSESSAADDSVRRMDDFITHEMWRQAALIYFYQSVHQLGPLAPAIRKALQQSLALGTRTVETLATAPVHHGELSSTISETFHFSSVHSHRAAPWFLAATVAVVEQERSLCREALKRCRPQKLAEQNLAAVERVWQVTDERGWPVNWKETLEQQGMFVTFIF